MVIKDGKIVEATENELYTYWLKRELYVLYDFSEYLRRMKDVGVKITEDNK